MRLGGAFVSNPSGTSLNGGVTGWIVSSDKVSASACDRGLSSEVYGFTLRHQ
jgi:hypothetical protein